MDKVSTLVNAARFDACGCGNTGSAVKSPLGIVYNAALPGGGCMPVLKVLMTNV